VRKSTSRRRSTRRTTGRLPLRTRGGELWHAHSTTLTLSYALTTLEGINAEDDLIEYAGTTYDPADDGTTVEVTVNDEPVEMNEYVLKDGDSVRIVVESTG